MGGEEKVVNHITYTVSDKPTFSSYYQFIFYPEYPVKSVLHIGLSNGNHSVIGIGEGTGYAYAPLDVSILGISFINGGTFMPEIEDDFYIYKIEL